MSCSYTVGAPVLTLSNLLRDNLSPVHIVTFNLIKFLYGKASELIL